MQVSFIIPLYNCLAHTCECLRTLQATLSANLAHEIILVDDGSTDGTREWLQTLSVPCRALLNERNLGFARTCNRGADAARGEYLFFLNNDLVLLPGWFEPMHALLSQRPEAALVGNVQLQVGRAAIDHSGVHFNHLGKPVHDTTRPWLARLTGHRRVDALTGACFGIKRRRWEDLGGFDPAFLNGCEDIDLCLRARAAGGQNFISLRSVVRHHISQSPGRKQRDEQNTRRLFLRRGEDIARLAARDWCRQFVQLHWDQSYVFDDALARRALGYWLGLLPAVPPAVLAGVQRSMARELTRWSEMFGVEVKD
jgi:GT2 family glycosyltransferase